MLNRKIKQREKAKGPLIRAHNLEMLLLPCRLQNSYSLAQGSREAWSDSKKLKPPIWTKILIRTQLV